MISAHDTEGIPWSEEEHRRVAGTRVALLPSAATPISEGAHAVSWDGQALVVEGCGGSEGSEKFRQLTLTPRCLRLGFAGSSWSGWTSSGGRTLTASASTT